ncbi:acyl-CoA thioesterase/bile acid-CoA:amino acid N-acyltransferase family protein [Parasphingorhabdus sp.]|uniref:acyl-CoA thioesterase/bile acid-CoA:amino acid N-acyltransferase family protein n=1 Tax=Parasphingorhabdus sp. TaxID=2709688 RepID=UPI0032ECB7EC
MASLNISSVRLSVSELPSITCQELEPFETITLRAHFVDEEGLTWSSWMSGKCDVEGRFDIAMADAIEGSYQGIDSAGLFWSMAPEGAADLDKFRMEAELITDKGPSLHSAGFPTCYGDEALRTTISLFRNGSLVNQQAIDRLRLPDNVVEEKLTGELTGSLFHPTDPSGCPPVIFISGSEGGVKRHQAMQLAQHGFCVLALGYFNCEGRPAQLERISIEYFEKGMDWLSQRTGEKSVGLIGGSRGGEGVLAIAALTDRPISAVVSMVPADIYCATTLFPEGVAPAWTHKGEVLPAAGLVATKTWADLDQYDAGELVDTTEMFFGFFFDEAVYESTAIPVEQVNAPIFFATGADDRCWPSHHATLRARERLKKAEFAYPVEHVFDESAGHLLGFPGLPTMMTTKMLLPPKGVFLGLGGTPQANSHNQRQSWSQMIKFLKKHCE